MKARYLLLSLVIAGCSGKPFVVEPEPELSPIRTHKISVVSHGWHAGLLIPGNELNRVIPQLKSRFGNPLFYEVGWGDKGFYQAQEITTGLTLQAMFWSEGAILHVVAVPQAPESYFAGEPLLSTCISDRELDSLIAFLANSFARDASGTVIDLKNGIYGDSEFYDGEGRYYLLNTCNKWTAKALRSSGLMINPALKLTAGSVMSYLESHRRACTKESEDAQQ